jgi:hypothetical protein
MLFRTLGAVLLAAAVCLTPTVQGSARASGFPDHPVKGTSKNRSFPRTCASLFDGMIRGDGRWGN